MAYGVSKSITENLRLGQHYSEMKKVISINIVYFDLGQGKDYIYRGVSDFKGLHQNDLLGLSEKQKSTFMKENVSDIFPEYYLLKVNQFNDIAKDTLDEWIYFLKNSEVKENFKAKGLKEANQVLDIMSLEDKDTYGYNRYLDSLHLKASEIFSLQTEAKFAREEGMKEGREEGMKEGREEGKKEIARKLIESGFDNDMIAKTTGLEIVEIEQLRKNK
jgi:predicted transposase/invertase (TIGR01784 family)